MGEELERSIFDMRHHNTSHLPVLRDFLIIPYFDDTRRNSDCGRVIMERTISLCCPGIMLIAYVASMYCNVAILTISPTAFIFAGIAIDARNAELINAVIQTETLTLSYCVSVH